jgi:endoglucanase
MRERRGTVLRGCLAVCLGLMLGVLVGGPASAMASGPPVISVVGTQLSSAGVSVQLRGVNRGAYSGCSGNAVYDATFAPFGDPDDDFADGPVNQWTVDVMKSWGINAVRLPVNESCWLGEPTAADAVAGQTPQPSECETYAPSVCETAADYRQSVEDYVDLLGANGLYVIVDLQDTAPPGYAADQVDHYPDAANAPTFWSQAAAAFGADPYVLFDLTGEIGAGPYDGHGSGTAGSTAVTV